MGRQNEGDQPEEVLAHYERNHGLQELSRNFGWVVLNFVPALAIIGRRDNIYNVIGHGIPQQIGVWVVAAGLIFNAARIGRKAHGQFVQSVDNYDTINQQGRQRGPDGQAGDAIPHGPDD